MTTWIFRIWRQPGRPVVIDEKRRAAPDRFRTHPEVADDQGRRVSLAQQGRRFVRPRAAALPGGAAFPPWHPSAARRESGSRPWSVHRRRCGKSTKIVPLAFASVTNRAKFSRLRARNSAGRSAVA